MHIRKLIGSLAVSAMLCIGVSPARAGIPVIDSAALSQQIQQVVAWVQQYQQMASQFQKLQQQFQQMQTMTQKLDGGRGLGTILSNPAIAAALPPEMRDAAALLMNPSASLSSPAAISGILASFGITNPGVIGAAQSNADSLGRMQSILTATQQRSQQITALAGRVDSAADAKESLDLLNRNTLEGASIQNQLMAAMASVEAARQQTELAIKARGQAFNDAAVAASRQPLNTFGR